MVTTAISRTGCGPQRCGAPQPRPAAASTRLSGSLTRVVLRRHVAPPQGRAARARASDEDLGSAGTSTSTSTQEAEVETDALESTDVDANREALSLTTQLLEVALLVCPFFFWGTTMVVMKELQPVTSPLFTASVRLIPAGFLLIAWAASRGIPQPKGFAAWAWIVAFAAIDATGFQGFLAEGLQRTSAGLGSVIIDSQPISVAILCALLFGEALSPMAISGLAVGVAGLSLLEVPPEAFDGFLSGGGVESVAATVAPAAEAGATSLWENGEFLMLLAAQSMAVGTVMVRGVTKYSHPIMATGWHMVLGGIPLAALCLSSEAAELAPRLAGITPSDIAALTYVAVFGGAAGYGAFFYNMSKGNLTKLSALTFLTPVFAASAGYLVLGETLNTQQLTGAAITIAAVYLINGGPGEDAKEA